MERRQFLRMTALGGTILLGAGRAAPVPAASAVDAVLLSCMDYRLMEAIERYMGVRGLRKKYDHLILAGASLGAVTEKYPAWSKTFWEHLAVAIDLHRVKKVIVLDHRDCGAYKVLLGEDFARDRAKETTVHTAKLHELRGQIVGKHPTLSVELCLMSLDGTVETIA